MNEDRCVLDPRQECRGLQKADMLEKQMDEYRLRARETHKEIFARLNELEQTDSARNQQYKVIMEKLDKLISWQEEQAEKPGRRWETVVETMILLAVTAVVAFVLGRIGL